MSVNGSPTMSQATGRRSATHDGVLGRLRRRVLGIDAQETSFAVRGFDAGTPAARAQLEAHAGAFVEGFNVAIAAREEDLEARLREVPAADRGFAYEGAAMALTLLDLLTPGTRSRLARLLDSHGRPHRYMAHVGAGWALAVLRRRPGTTLKSFDPFIRWLVTDGYGFHEGFFHTSAAFAGKPPLRRPRGYEQRALDQGLGRSLWFVAGADVDVAAAKVAAFAAQRRADLWSGLGLAAAYTTVASPADLRRLAEAAGPHHAHVVQGAAFAVSARLGAGNVQPHTRAAAEILCGASAEHVAEVVEAARDGLRADRTGVSYERWRTRIREQLVGVPSGVA